MDAGARPTTYSWVLCALAGVRASRTGGVLRRRIQRHVHSHDRTKVDPRPFVFLETPLPPRLPSLARLANPPNIVADAAHSSVSTTLLTVDIDGESGSGRRPSVLARPHLPPVQSITHNIPLATWTTLPPPARPFSPPDSSSSVHHALRAAVCVSGRPAKAVLGSLCKRPSTVASQDQALPPWPPDAVIPQAALFHLQRIGRDG